MVPIHIQTKVFGAGDGVAAALDQFVVFVVTVGSLFACVTDRDRQEVVVVAVDDTLGEGT